MMGVDIKIIVNCGNPTVTTETCVDHYSHVGVEELESTSLLRG